MTNLYEPKLLQYNLDYRILLIEKDTDKIEKDTKTNEYTETGKRTYKEIKKLKTVLCFREDSDLNIKFAFEKAVKKYTHLYLMKNTQTIKYEQNSLPERKKLPVAFCFVKKKESTAEILLLCSNWRSKGQGKVLLEFIIGDLKLSNIRSIFVEGLDNKKLIEFYKNLGFTNGKKEDFTESPPDNQLQSLSLELGGKSSSNKVNSESLVLKLDKPEPEWIMWN